MTEILKSVGEQMVDLLLEEPQHYDVVFSVGPKNIKVKAIRFILKAASPVFRRQFKENWESAVMKEGEGISLSDVDPDVFKLFVYLIISDKWSVDDLKSLDLDFATMLNLLALCRRFQITKGIKNLEEATDHLIQDFYIFKDTPKVLEMSRENLETILSCDTIPLDEKEIFDCACRWAEHKCKQKKIELTGENFREALGSCFFEIRFPTMNFETFMKIGIFKRNLFTAEEKVAIYEFIGLHDDEKAKYDKTQLSFQTRPRCPGNLFSGLFVLRLPTQFKITTNPSFPCVENMLWNDFQVNKKISLHGVGFLGPIDADTNYDVTVRIRKIVGGSYKTDGLTLRKNVFARKGEIFHCLFDEPIVIKANTYESPWRNFYDIAHSLTGENSVSQYEPDYLNVLKSETVQISGVEFNLNHSWSAKPLAEFLFKQID